MAATGPRRTVLVVAQTGRIRRKHTHYHAHLLALHLVFVLLRPTQRRLNAHKVTTPEALV
jgi:hypothetical protein